MLSVTVNHTFEAGHRLPHITGKCQSLHGHSWAVTVELSSIEQHDDVIIMFGDAKNALRTWVDTRLDHGLILGEDDPLAPILVHEGKVYVVGIDEHSEDMAWPTVENVARIIARAMQHELPDVSVLTVTVRETPTNMATWRA